MRFLLFNSPKPLSQVRILIYRNWAIRRAEEIFDGEILKSTMGDTKVVETLLENDVF